MGCFHNAPYRARSCFARGEKKCSLFRHLNIGVSRGDRFAAEGTIRKWQKKRNSRSELLDVRRNPRKKKKFREFLTNGAFSRNENVINRERYTYVLYICRPDFAARCQGRKIFPMAFFAMKFAIGDIRAVHIIFLVIFFDRNVQKRPFYARQNFNLARGRPKQNNHLRNALWAIFAHLCRRVRTCACACARV